MTRLALTLLCLTASTAFAQQSLFNVPSAQETVPGRLFGQVQMTGTGEAGEVNTTLELGLFRWLEVGFNIFHVELYHLGGALGDGPAMPTTTLNANVWLEFNSLFSMEAGAQGGVGFLPGTLQLEPVVFGWAALRLDAPGRWGSYVVGAYTGTRGALGAGPPAGGLFGLEVPLVEHVLHAQADWVIGLNAISVAVVGVVIYIGRNFQLALGGQLPSPGSGNHFGGVVEFTYVPSPPGEGEGLGDPSERPQQRNKPAPTL